MFSNSEHFEPRGGTPWFVQIGLFLVGIASLFFSVYQGSSSWSVLAPIGILVIVLLSWLGPKVHRSISNRQKNRKQLAKIREEWPHLIRRMEHFVEFVNSSNQRSIHFVLVRVLNLPADETIKARGHLLTQTLTLINNMAHDLLVLMRRTPQNVYEAQLLARQFENLLSGLEHSGLLPFIRDDEATSSVQKERDELLTNLTHFHRTYMDWAERMNTELDENLFGTHARL